tara:strand:+ start:12811 stop:13383 length:573 start_codon:yes stop_codon:yes gene_type:complete
MSLPKKPDNAQLTTYQIIDTFIELQEMLDYPELRPEDTTEEEIEKGLAELANVALKKTENIHWVLSKLDENEKALDAMLQVHRNYIKSLMNKKDSLHNGRERLKSMIINMVDLLGTPNKSGNHQIKTTTDSYTIYEGDGSLEITDEESVPDEFLKLVQSIDKRKLRKHVIEKGGKTEYAKVAKKTRLRIS